MSEINSIANGSFVLGHTSAINFEAGPGISITQPSEGTVRIGNDETVLWEGSANTGTLNFSEPLTSFKEFKFYVYLPERGTNQVLTYYDAVNTVNPGFLQLTMNTMTTGSVVSDWWKGVYNINATVNTATYQSISIYANGQYYKQCSTTACGTNDSKLVIKKVIGIGRKEV